MNKSTAIKHIKAASQLLRGPELSLPRNILADVLTLLKSDGPAERFEWCSTIITTVLHSMICDDRRDVVDLLYLAAGATAKATQAAAVKARIAAIIVALP